MLHQIAEMVHRLSLCRGNMLFQAFLLRCVLSWSRRKEFMSAATQLRKNKQAKEKLTFQRHSSVG